MPLQSKKMLPQFFQASVTNYWKTDHYVTTKGFYKLVITVEDSNMRFSSADTTVITHTHQMILNFDKYDHLYLI